MSSQACSDCMGLRHLLGVDCVRCGGTGLALVPPTPRTTRLPQSSLTLWKLGAQGTVGIRGDKPSPLAEALVLAVSELERMYAEHDEVHAVVERNQHGPAMAWLNGFAEIRDIVFPDTMVAQICKLEREKREERYKADPSRYLCGRRLTWQDDERVPQTGWGTTSQTFGRPWPTCNQPEAFRGVDLHVLYAHLCETCWAKLSGAERRRYAPLAERVTP